MERSLIQAEKIVTATRMASAIAHEVNNPLASTTNLVYLARTNTPNSIKVARFLDIAECEPARLTHLVKQALGHYRGHSAACPISLSASVLEALNLYEPRLKTLGIEVAKGLAICAQLVLMKGEIMQVVSSLIMNAMHAMPSGGLLSVTVEELHGDGSVFRSLWRMKDAASLRATSTGYLNPSFPLTVTSAWVWDSG